MSAIFQVFQSIDQNDPYTILSSNETFYLSNILNYKQKIENFVNSLDGTSDYLTIQQIIDHCITNIQKLTCIQLNLFCLYLLSNRFDSKLSTYFPFEQLANNYTKLLPQYSYIIAIIIANPKRVMEELLCQKYFTIIFPKESNILPDKATYNQMLIDDIENECREKRSFRSTKRKDIKKNEGKKTDPDIQYHEKEGMKNKFQDNLEILSSKIKYTPFLKDYYFEIKEIIKIFWNRISHQGYWSDGYTIETKFIKLLNYLLTTLFEFYSSHQSIDSHYLQLANQYQEFQHLFIEIKEKALNTHYPPAKDDLSSKLGLKISNWVMDKQCFNCLEDCYSTLQITCSQLNFNNQNMISFIYQYVLGKELESILKTKINEMVTPINFLYETFKNKQLYREKTSFSIKQLQAMGNLISFFYNPLLKQENELMFKEIFLYLFSLKFQMHELNCKGFVNEEAISNQEKIVNGMIAFGNMVASSLPGVKQAGEGIKQASRNTSKTYTKKSFHQIKGCLNLHELHDVYLPVICQRIILTDEDFMYFSLNLLTDQRRKKAMNIYVEGYVNNLYATLSDLQNKEDLEIFQELPTDQKNDYLFTITMSQQPISLEAFMLKKDI